MSLLNSTAEGEKKMKREGLTMERSDGAGVWWECGTARGARKGRREAGRKAGEECGKAVAACQCGVPVRNASPIPVAAGEFI
jgi:hypothetical protein